MHSSVERLLREIDAGLHGLNAAQTQLRPAGDGAHWNIQQIAKHLLLTYTATSSLLEASMAEDEPVRALRTLSQRIAQCAVCRFGYFPEGRKSPELVAPPAMEAAISGAALTALMGAALTRLEEDVSAVEQLPGRQRCTSHHVLGPLSARQWLRFHLVHGRHHLRQIRAIRSAHKV